MFIKEDIVNRLQNGSCRVTFTKVNGDTRTLNCTLNPELLPTTEKTVNGDVTKEHKDSISVWDIDLNEWRSFRFDRVTNIA